MALRAFSPTLLRLIGWFWKVGAVDVNCPLFAEYILAVPMERVTEKMLILTGSRLLLVLFELVSVLLESTAGSICGILSYTSALSCLGGSFGHRPMHSVNKVDSRLVCRASPSRAHLYIISLCFPQSQSCKAELKVLQRCLATTEVPVLKYVFLTH